VRTEKHPGTLRSTHTQGLATMMIPTLIPAEPLAPDTLPIAEADRPVALVVDDDPDTRRHIKVLLEHDGWSVREARNGEQARLLGREHVPEVILLDLALPTISGLDVLRTLKTWGDQPTRVVVVSAFTSSCTCQICSW